MTADIKRQHTLDQHQHYVSIVRKKLGCGLWRKKNEGVVCSLKSDTVVQLLPCSPLPSLAQREGQVHDEIGDRDTAEVSRWGRAGQREVAEVHSKAAQQLQWFASWFNLSLSCVCFSLRQCFKDLGQSQNARKMCEAACSMTATSKEVNFSSTPLGCFPSNACCFCCQGSSDFNEPEMTLRDRMKRHRRSCRRFVQRLDSWHRCLKKKKKIPFRSC